MNDFIHKYGKPDVHFDSCSSTEHELASNLSLEPPQIDELIDRGDYSVHLNLTHNPLLQPHHIDKLIDKDKFGVRQALGSHPSLTPEQRARLK